MKKEDIINQYKLRDRVVRIITKDGYFRAVCIKNTNSAITAQKNHELSHFQAGLLARTMSASTMMASFLKGEERIIVQFDGDGPISKVFAESLQVGEVRGFVKYDNKFDFENITNIEEFLGNGTLKVSKVIYNKTEPIVGIIPITKGDITSDINNYFSQSEQIDSIVRLDVEIDDWGNIIQSGGLIIQTMPGYDISKLTQIIEKVNNSNKISHYLNNGLNPLEILKEIIPMEFDVLSSTQVDFFCRCSKELFMQKLISINLKDIIEMQENNESELVCQYCNRKYYLDKDDFNKLITEMRALRN